MLLEIATNSVENALQAERAGAGRIELCDNLGEGGTTPSIGMIEGAVAALSIPVFVMIRPRGGDFLYSSSEVNVMLRDIEAAKAAGVHGVVFGLLNADGSIDAANTAELIAAARPMKVTFHRAFDLSAEPLKALDVLIKLGVDRLLTSGQQSAAPAGAALISQLVERADGRLVVMPGAGVNAANVAQLMRETNASEVHCSALKRVPSKMTFRHEGVSMGAASETEFQTEVCDSDKITGILLALKSL